LRHLTAKARGSIYLVICAGTTAVIFCLAEILNVGYYTHADLLGPFSKLPVVFVSLAAVAALAMSYAYRSSFRGNASMSRWSILLPPLVLLILYLLFLPDAIESYYATNYYDVPAHMARATYVLLNGKANVNIDSYFDMQPGVFFSTAMFVLVTGIGPQFIAKWFPLFFVVFAYVPAVALFGKLFFKNARELAIFVFITLAIMWPPTRYHYSAQVYVLPLLLMLLAFIIRVRPARERLIVVVILSAGIIPTHQGGSLFALAMLASIVVFNGVERFVFHRTERAGSMLGATMLFALMWASYLCWLATYAFGDFLGQLGHVAGVILSGIFSEIFSHAIMRPDAMYQLLVYGKVSFAMIIYLISLPVLAYLWLKKGVRQSGALLLTILGTSSIIFLLGFALGGIGYVERAVLVTAPFLAIGLAFFASKLGMRNSHFLIAAMLIFLVVTGSALFNSSRNFQSWSYSEDASGQFMNVHDPSGALVYHNPRVSMPGCSYTETGTSINLTPNHVTMLLPSCAIEGSYWMAAALDWVALLHQAPTLGRIYSNGICSSYIVTWVA